MREIRQSGSVGGELQTNAASLPQSTDGAAEAQDMLFPRIGGLKGSFLDRSLRRGLQATTKEVPVSQPYFAQSQNLRLRGHQE